MPDQDTPPPSPGASASDLHQDFQVRRAANTEVLRAEIDAALGGMLDVLADIGADTLTRGRARGLREQLSEVTRRLDDFTLGCELGESDVLDFLSAKLRERVSP